MQRPKKKCAKCGHAHNGEWRQGTNACFGCVRVGTCQILSTEQRSGER